jgi:hypothetical protein
VTAALLLPTVRPQRPQLVLPLGAVPAMLPLLLLCCRRRVAPSPLLLPPPLLLPDLLPGQLGLPPPVPAAALQHAAEPPPSPLMLQLAWQLMLPPAAARL